MSDPYLQDLISSEQKRFLPFVQRFFGEHANGEIMRFTEACASKGKIAPSPIFEYAAEQTVSGRIVCIGDAAHLSTPWYVHHVRSCTAPCACTSKPQRTCVYVHHTRQMQHVCMMHAAYRTAAGAYTAMLDAVGLRDVFKSGSADIDRALRAYDKGAIQRATDLMRQSRACSRRLIPRAGKGAIPSPPTLVGC